MSNGDCLEIGQWRTSGVDICPVDILPSTSTLFQIYKQSDYIRVYYRCIREIKRLVMEKKRKKLGIRVVFRKQETGSLLECSRLPKYLICVKYLQM